MARNFKITAQRSRKNLSLSLAGDFDGSSAFELLHALQQKGADSQTIVVNTDGLASVLPFGREMLQRNFFTLNGLRARIHFTGPHRAEFHPEAALSL